MIVLFIAGLFLSLYLIPYISALQQDDASLVAPLFQLQPIFVLLFSAIFLKEVLTGREMIGFLIIFLSGMILSIERFDIKVFKLRKSLYLMILASLCVAFSAIAYKFVVVRVDFWISLAYESIGMGISMLCFLCYKPFLFTVMNEVKHITISTFIILSINDAINFLAQMLQAYAYLLAPVALVNVTNGLSPFLLLIYGIVLSIFFPHIIKEDIRISVIIRKVIVTAMLFVGLIFVYNA